MKAAFCGVRMRGPGFSNDGDHALLPIGFLELGLDVWPGCFTIFRPPIEKGPPPSSRAPVDTRRTSLAPFLRTS